MNQIPRITRWLDLLRETRPPASAVLIGAAIGDSPWAHFLRNAAIPRILAVETDPTRFQQLERSAPDGWEVLCEVPAPTDGPVEFHRSSLRWAAGTIDPAFLVPLWPGIRPMGSEIRNASRFSQIAGSRGLEPKWVFIDCLPAAAVLDGYAGIADHAELVVARVITPQYDGLETCALDHLQPRMEHSGFNLIAVEFSRNPSVAHALFMKPGILTSSSGLENFPEISRFLAEELDSVEQNTPPTPWVRSHLTILRSELGLMKAELLLAENSGQLAAGHSTHAETSSSSEEADRRWLDELGRKAKSQLEQDLWVLKMTSYKRGGFFVEFGATDGVLLSNTHLLEKEFGWRGICAEPNPTSFEALARNRWCMVSPACIGPVTGEEVEFIFADAYGGMSKDLASNQHQEKREAYQQAGHTAVLRTISLHDFLTERGAPRMIDYMSIDTEGSEFSILERFPFDLWDVRLLTIEHNFTEQREWIRELLERHGYVRIEAQWDDWYLKQP